ncbi:alpha/beta fold hydrolase [Nonomuraea diastatica]|uniref:Alpha/beta hydrolase n=1 Tax=Nonomuraea diastatica TaxID=1848329 RepID=A0A4R4WW65_9ACTN|nr:alpha/beta hydrolase [Nonomuraea diastatica]TDD21918.1 alpha/beta hydrolase [Nonomuraea diastatica]
MRVMVNGTSLFVDVEGPALVPDGDTMRAKPTLLLLHGGPGHDHSIFKPTYARLADLVQIVYVDQRGNGRSQDSDPSTWHLDQWADDIPALCDALGITKPIVLGWSFGGIVAMHYAARHPDHPAKLILQSTMARMDVDQVVEGFRAEAGEAAALAAKAFLTEGTPETFAEFGRLCAPSYSPEPAFPSPEDIQAMMRMIPNPELTMSFMSRERFDLRGELENVRCPALVAAGARDPITPLTSAREIMTGLPAGARLEVFEESGHFIADTEGERFFALLRAFIEAP